LCRPSTLAILSLARRAFTFGILTVLSTARAAPGRWFAAGGAPAVAVLAFVGRVTLGLGVLDTRVAGRPAMDAAAGTFDAFEGRDAFGNGA
jgi:hypothetical protein